MRRGGISGFKREFKTQIPSKTMSVITLRSDSHGPQFLPALLNRNTLRCKGLSIRSSCRWIDAFNTPNGGMNVPFIDNLGRFSGFTLARWSCDPRSLIMSVVSTILKRIVNHARKHNPWRIVKKRLSDLAAAASYYALSKNNYFWDRVLFFSRNLERYKKPLRTTRIYFTSKWDENKRFVYSHVIFQTKWLLFRALLPRDKSQFFNADSGKRKWSNPESAPSKLNVTSTLRDFAYAISLV